jgi:hypothetical protein
LLPPPATKPPTSTKTVPDPVDPPKPPDTAKPPPGPTADERFEKRLARAPEDLLADLQKVPELRLLGDLEILAAREAPASGSPPRLPVVSPAATAYAINVKLHKDFRKAGTTEGLPLQLGARCMLDQKTAAMMQTLSKELRSMGFVSVPGIASSVRLPTGRVVNVRGTGIAAGTAPEKVDAFKDWCDVNHIDRLPGTLPTLVQMLQVEDTPARLLLVKELAKSATPATTAALASRALMDLTPEVRQAAIEALQKRPADQYLTLLIKGLRYPWAPVADHAAVALVKLKPEGALPRLVKLLDKANPAGPHIDKTSSKTVVKEVVRLNHMRNCLLCHAPSAGPADGMVRAPVPTPGQPLPPAYYQEQSARDWVRADITFLRQDFSVNLPVDNAAPWPAEQRFDFITRTRKPQPDEKLAIAAPYPQRDAVLYSLRGITGKDAGTTSAGWSKMLDIVSVPPSSAPVKEPVRQP